MDKGAYVWYQYARSQGLQNSNSDKFVLKHVIPEDKLVCEYKEVDRNHIVYAGIYIVVKDKSKTELIRSILSSREFCKYLLLIGKDMNGGYKFINAKAIKNYGIKDIAQI